MHVWITSCSSGSAAMWDVWPKDLAAMMKLRQRTVAAAAAETDPVKRSVLRHWGITIYTWGFLLGGRLSVKFTPFGATFTAKVHSLNIMKWVKLNYQSPYQMNSAGGHPAPHILVPYDTLVLPRAHSTFIPCFEFPSEMFLPNIIVFDVDYVIIIFLKILMAPSEIWQPWHAFFGNPEI